MKHLSLEKLAEIVTSKRKAMKLSQVVTAERAGMNRSLLSRLEQQEFTPSVDQLLALAEVLEFDHRDVFVDDTAADVTPVERKKIAVAGTGYVGMSIAVLLAQYNKVIATPTNYDTEKAFFDTSALEAVIVELFRCAGESDPCNCRQQPHAQRFHCRSCVAVCGSGWL